MKPTLITWIERVNRNLLLLGVGLLLASLALFRWQFETLRAVTFGPPPVDISSFAGALGSDELKVHWAEVQGTRAIDTGFQTVEAAPQRERVAGNFVALESGEHLLLVKVGRLTPSLRFRGRLVDVPSSVREDVIQPIMARYPNTDGHFLPVMLVESGMTSFEAGAVAACLALCVLAFLAMYRGAKGMEEPQHYSSLRRVARWSDPREIIEMIEQELHNDHNQAHLRGLIVTTNWLVARGIFRLELAALGELAWLYKKPRGVWDISPRSTLIFYLERGERLELTLLDKDCDRLVTEIAVRAPWIVTGYNKNIEVLWISDRQAFLAELNSRRQKVAPITRAAS